MTQMTGFSAHEAPLTADNRVVELVVRWGGRVVDVRRLRATKAFTVGTAADDDMNVPSDRGSWTVLTSSPEQGWLIRFKGGMQGSVTRGDRTSPLSSSGALRDGDAWALPLTDDTVVTIALGQQALQVRAVAKSRSVVIAPFFDALWANAALVSMMAVTTLVAALFLHPVDMDTIDRQVEVTSMHLQTVVLKPTPQTMTFIEKIATTRAVDERVVGGGRTAPKRPVPPRPRGSSAEDKAIVEAAIEALGQTGDVISADNFGALGEALGTIDGDKLASAHGVGRLGVRGDGVGAGIGVGTLASGEIVTRGRRFADGRYGETSGDIGTKADRDITFANQPGIVVGSLDPDLIRRVVKEHSDQARYCYERQLSVSPGLAGKVTMKWVIGADGKVLSAMTADSQLDNAAVEDCLTTRIKTWLFPKPKGGGIVVVNYPFVFKQAG